VQFGVYGAVIPLVLVCLMYIGFSASGSLLAGQAVAQLLHVQDWQGIVLFAAAIVVLTIFGYRVIHMIGRVASIIGVIAFVYLFGALLAGNDVGALLGNKHFSLSSFLLAISLSASWQIAFGPYVADYSRYLPRSTSASKTFWAVGLGSVLGAQASMVFGVFAAALAGKEFAHHEVSFIVGLGGTGIVAALLYFSVAFGKVTITTLNAYGSFMSIATIVSGFRGSRHISSGLRLTYIFAMVGIATALALLGKDSFLKDFSAFILFLLAFFTPWSAINLVDFYCITKERYDIPALSNPDGRYGRWNWIGISIYVFGVLIQMPFISTHFYTGPLVASLDDTDISWIIGLVVPAVMYYFVARKWPGNIADRLIFPEEQEATQVRRDGPATQAAVN
jgi:NCS1 family nucleobase:cation symporter-1